MQRANRSQEPRRDLSIASRPIVGSSSKTPIELFVEELAALELVNRPADYRTKRLLVRLTQWATSQGIPLKRELIFDPDTIERFVEIALARDRSQATYRTVLRAVGPKVTKKAPWEPRPLAIPRRQIALPYVDQEIVMLWTAAKHQPTERTRRAAFAFLVLGLGAGLDGRWVSKVRAPDVASHKGAVSIAVRAPSPRAVVVRAIFENDVLELAKTAGSEFLVGGKSVSVNRTGHLVSSLVVPTGHPTLAPARLRSTWLLWHLTAGTRLPELCLAAGLQGPAMLGELLSLVPPLSSDQATKELRGASR
jgi:hypothetical protein